MKTKYFIAYIMLVGFFFVLLMNGKLLSLDEIWCYGYAKRIADGYIPYRDYNLIQTPLFFFLGSLFSKSLMLFRFYGALINSSIVLLTFYICYKNKVDKQLTLIFILINCFFVSILAYASYNTLLLLGLMILYLIAIRFFKDIDNEKALLFGFFLSVLLLIKQNVPGILIIIYTSILLIMLFKRYITVKIFAHYAIGGILPVLIFICYSIYNNSFISFVDNTIFQVYTFSQNTVLEDGCLSLILMSIVITIYIAIHTLKSKNNLFVTANTLIFSLCSYMLIYPLMDVYHALLLLTLNVFLFATLFEDITIKLKFIKPVIILSFIIVCIFAIYLKPSNEGFIRSDINYYNNILISENIDKNIHMISNYIKKEEESGLDVAVIGYDSYLYNIPADDVNGILDSLPAGKNDKVITLIKEKDIILTNDFNRYKDIKEIKEYVYNNFVLDGAVGNMKIYRHIKY